MYIGELRVMFAQEEISGAYMDRFFADNPNNTISWLDDMGKERYGTSAASLLAESEKSNNLEVAHVSLHYDSMNVVNLWPIAYVKHRQTVSSGPNV